MVGRALNVSDTCSYQMVSIDCNLDRGQKGFVAESRDETRRDELEVHHSGGGHCASGHCLEVAGEERRGGGHGGDDGDDYRRMMRERDIVMVWL